jgi:undecaprenyl-phosphate galactose phosphotransferase/putative colanic acid biosynthesis UDP-glucose lipid carrier transferase
MAAVSESPFRGVARRRGLRRRLPFNLIEHAVIVADLFIVIATSVIAGVGYHWVFLGNSGHIQTFLGVGFLVFFNFSAISVARGDYRVLRLLDFRRELRDTTRYWAFVCFVLLTVAFALKTTETLSRGATLTFFVVGWAFMVAWRGALAQFLARALTDGGFAERKMLIIAEESQLASSKVLLELRQCGYNSIKTLVVKQREIAAIGTPPSLRAALDEIIETSRREQIDDVFLAIGWNHFEYIERVLSALRVLPLPIHLVPDKNVDRFLARPLVNVGTTRMIELTRSPLTPGEELLKRTIDVLAAALVLVIACPLMLLTGLLIKLDSQGPVFFTQTRHGFNGRSFRILKFRTMYVLEDGPVIRQATRNDPRVTRLGRFLRRMNIDELPQLFNVIAGHMSLVGPRPHAAAHDMEYEKLVANYAFRHHMKPGITGWAQVNGLRGETKTIDLMRRRIEADLWYIKNWSVWLDIWILIRTIFLVFQTPAR